MVFNVRVVPVLAGNKRHIICTFHTDYSLENNSFEIKNATHSDTATKVEMFQGPPIRVRNGDRYVM